MTKFMLVLATAALSTQALAYSEKESREIQKDIASAHLNLAVKLANAAAKGYTCEVDAYETSIVEELSKYSTESKDLIPAVRNNAVLKKVLVTNFAFKVLVAGSVFKDLTAVEAGKLLPGAVFYARNGGAYGPKQVLMFAADGALKIDNLIIKDDGSTKHVITKGAYRLQQGTSLQIELDLGSDGGKKLYKLNRDSVGEQSLVPVGGEAVDGFSSSPMECEA